MVFLRIPKKFHAHLQIARTNFEIPKDQLIIFDVILDPY